MEPSKEHFSVGPPHARSVERVVLSDELALSLGSLRVEPSLRRVAQVDGREEIVEPRVMQVLVALIRAEGRILSRDELMTRCWHGVVVGDDAINRVMSRLRRLADGIGDGAFKLETITKVGFRLVWSERAPFTPLLSAPEKAIALAPSGLAVLPFDNMSADPEQDYFSDGITEDIITDLSKISALRVIGRNASFAFKGHVADVREVGRELNVGHVLEGSVRKSGDRVRITAQLTSVADGFHAWAERWDRELTNIFAIQDEISKAVVDALKLRLLPSEKDAIEHRGTTSPEAYNLYLMARQYRTSGNEGDPEREETIVRLSRRAVEIDPNYAHAWAFLARSQSFLYFYYNRGDDDGMAAVERALALNPDLAEAYTAKARRLTNLGRAEEAFEALLVALKLDPECWEANKDAGLLSFRKQNFDDAARYYRKSSSLVDADFASPMMLFNCNLSLDDRASAREAARLTFSRAELAVLKDRTNGSAMAAGCIALAFLGEAERAHEWAKRALLIDPDNLIMRYNLACALSAYLQDADGALNLLAMLFDVPDSPWLKHARIDPELDRIRNHPGFQALVAAAEIKAANDIEAAA